SRYIFSPSFASAPVYRASARTAGTVLSSVRSRRAYPFALIVTLDNAISISPSADLSPQPKRVTGAFVTFLSSIHSLEALSVVPIHAISFMITGEKVGDMFPDGMEHLFGTGEGTGLALGEGDGFGVADGLGDTLGVVVGDVFG